MLKLKSHRLMPLHASFVVGPEYTGLWVVKSFVSDTGKWALKTIRTKNFSKCFIVVMAEQAGGKRSFGLIRAN
ncbi:MAG: hypothetical protein ACE5JO_04605 [Candidatus Binatia bacterium]